MNFAQMLDYGPRLGTPSTAVKPPRTYRRYRAGEGKRICSCCKDELPATEQYFRYGKTPSGKYIMRSTCRKCEGIKIKERRKRQRAEARK